MKKFAFGFLAGITLGATVPVAASAFVNGSGYLSGWSVTKNGHEICYMPYVWSSTREIECD